MYSNTAKYHINRRLTAREIDSAWCVQLRRQVNILQKVAHVNYASW